MTYEKSVEFQTANMFFFLYCFCFWFRRKHYLTSVAIAELKNAQKREKNYPADPENSSTI